VGERSHTVGYEVFQDVPLAIGGCGVPDKNECGWRWQREKTNMGVYVNESWAFGL
jgi:hypothetical protein